MSIMSSFLRKKKKLSGPIRFSVPTQTPRWKHPPPGLVPKQESAGFQKVKILRFCGHMASVTAGPLSSWRIKTSVDDTSLSERAGLQHNRLAETGSGWF